MPLDLDHAASLIESSGDYRLLRRVPQPVAWPVAAASGETRKAVFLDTETTGLDIDTDEVIELALLPFEYERATGQVVRVDETAALSAFRQPSFAIPPESTLIHRISDSMVTGQTITHDQVSKVIEPADLIIAHNAAFDRSMVEKHWPAFKAKHWACSYADIDWEAEGLSSSKLDYLLYRQGWFHEEHRALADAKAAVFLLTLPLPISKKVALDVLLDRARRPLFAVRAEETAFEQRAALKLRGYKWDAGTADRIKAWWILTDDPQREIDWLRDEIYGASRNIPTTHVPATRRYSSRVWID